MSADGSGLIATTPAPYLWYDQATGKWLYLDPATNQTRDATEAESRAWMGASGLDPAAHPPGTGGAQDQSGGSASGNPPALSPAPAGNAPTSTSAGDGSSAPGVGWGQTPPQTGYGWGTGFTGSHAGATSPFADQTGLQQAYYQLHPDEANYLLRSWLAPNASSPFAQFIDARAPDLYKQFTQASTQSGNENLQYTDWLKAHYGQLGDQFAGQSATQRQENPLAFGGGFAGRRAY